MTISEAIEILRDTPIDIRSTREDDIHTLYATAQNMAIEALRFADEYHQNNIKTYAHDMGVSLEQAEHELSCSEKPNESDLISRQDAIDAVIRNTFRLTFAEEQNCEGHVAWSANAVYSDVMEGALLELPSAQPERMGEWVNARDGYDGHVKCNKCFKTYDWTSDAQYFNFCPNCGAEMRGAQDG